MSTDEEDDEYFRNPDFKKTLARYEEALVNEQPVYMEADELTDIAEYYMTCEREQDADRAIQYALALHPDSVDPQVFLARKQLFKGNMAEARRISKAIVDQDDREVKFLNAEILIKEDRTRDATLYLLGVWHTLEDDCDHFLYDCAGIFMDYNQWEYAMMWANRLQRLYPSYPKVGRLRAELMVCMGRYAEAIPLLNKILDDNPYNKDIWNLLAESQGAQEQYSEAVESAEYVLAIDKTDKRAMVTKASCLFHMNQPQEAHLLYQAYLQSLSDDDNVLYLDAVCLASMDHYVEAAKQIGLALEYCEKGSPQHARILVEQAYVESKLHHLQNALDAIAQAENIRFDDLECDYDLLRGQVYLDNRNLEEALPLFTESIRKSIDKRNTLMMIAVALGEAEYYDEAIKLMDIVYNRFPEKDSEDADSPIPYLAYYYNRKGDDESSLFYLKHAAEVDRACTERLFSSVYPGVTPEEYYLYAYRNVYGHFPKEDE